MKKNKIMVRMFSIRGREKSFYIYVSSIKLDKATELDSFSIYSRSQPTEVVQMMPDVAQYPRFVSVSSH